MKTYYLKSDDKTIVTIDGGGMNINRIRFTNFEGGAIEPGPEEFRRSIDAFEVTIEDDDPGYPYPINIKVVCQAGKGRGGEDIFSVEQAKEIIRSIEDAIEFVEEHR